MGTALITLPDGRRAKVTFDSPEQLDAAVNDLTGSMAEQAPPSKPDSSAFDDSDRFKNNAMNFTREAARVVGRGAANLVDGVSALPRMVADIPINIANAMGAQIPTFSQNGLASQPELAPQNELEAYGDNVTRALGGVLAGTGVGSALANSAAPAVRGVGQSLAANPVIQTVSAMTGTTAAEGAREAGAGQTGQLVAGLAGGIAPGVIASAAPAATRASFRGGEKGRRQVEQNIDTFSRVGTAPSVGQATQNRRMQAAESLLSKAPGGAGQMASKAESQADQISDAIEKRAAQLMKKTTAQQAGTQIERSIKGEGGFIDRFKTRQEQLYDRLDAFFPAKRPIQVESTRRALKDLNQDIEGAEALSQWFKNGRIQGIEKAFKKDTAAPDVDTSSPLAALQGAKTVKEIDSIAEKLKIGAAAEPTAEQQALEDSFFSMRTALAAGKRAAEQQGKDIPDIGTLPYEAVKKLRTLVGRELADAGIASDVPRSKWKALYAALSNDLGAAVEKSPVAKAAWSRANNFTKFGMRRIEAIESVIDRNGGPESIFKAATSGTKEGATTLRAVMQSVDDEGKKMISATVLRRLGIAKAGVQGELGDKFSTESFLTNWNLLSPEAKRTLFDRYGASFRSDMDQVAKVAANLRSGSQVFKNPSGTAQASTQYATAGAFAISLITGQIGAAATIATGVGATNLSARLMTNPRFVKWLAQSTRFPKGAYAAQVNRLAQQATNTGDEDLARAVAILEQGNKNQDEE